MKTIRVVGMVLLCLALLLVSASCGKSDKSPPSSPANLAQTTSDNDNTPTFTWEASSDDSLGVVTYLVKIDDKDWVYVEDTTYTPFYGVTDGDHTFQVKAVDEAANESDAATLSFTCHASPPLITDVTASSITQTSATIAWATDEPGTSQVEYGTDLSYGATSVLGDDLVTVHNVTLSGLSADRTYHYRVKSRDSLGNEATSGDYTFTMPDTIAPTLSGVSVSAIGETTATISWTTNEPATSQVEYGVSAAYGLLTSRDATLAASHSVTITGLSPNTIYHYRVESDDASGNISISGDFTLTTDKETKTVGGLITENTTWASEYIYLVTSNVGIEQGVILTIQPGTRVEFNSACYLKVMGMLKAIGTPENPIIFTSSSSPLIPYQWNGIRFPIESAPASFDGEGNYVDGSTIQFATIEYAGQPAGIYITDGSPFIYQCLIQNNWVGMQIEGIVGPLEPYAQPVVRNCTFEDNGASSWANYLTLEVRSRIAPIVEHNVIYGRVSVVGSSGVYQYNRIDSDKGSILVSLSVWVSAPTIRYNTLIGKASIGGQGEVIFGFNNLSKGGSDYAFAAGYQYGVSISDNWWGSTDTTVVDSLIYDYFDNFELGQVTYQPIATAPIPEAP